MNNQKFIIRGSINDVIPIISKFPGGEIKVTIPDNPKLGDSAHIVAHLLNSDDIMTLIMITDALRRMNVLKVRLTMPYIPYARQDRVCNSGEAFSLEAFAKIINSLNFRSIVVYDAHSLKSLELIDRCINVDQLDLIKSNKNIADYFHNIVNNDYKIYLVSPDEGAVNKTQKIYDCFENSMIGFNLMGIVNFEKVRNPSTGVIEKFIIKNPEIIENVFNDDHFLIVDDIGDGFGTHIGISKILKEYNPKAKDISLYVTHGIFSKGKEILKEHFNNVWCEVDFTEFKND